MLINSPLLTDQYEFVMAHSYWKSGMAEKTAVFHLFFRSHPFQSNYTITCGLNRLIEFLNNWQLSEKEIDYLSQLKTPAEKPLLESDFLKYLKTLKFTCNLDAIPEGTVVFPLEPLLRIEGSLLQCQLLETALINLIQFPTLVATKASRLFFASEKSTIVEFGLRRAQGPDGGVTASRAAYIGGCKGTSNLLAGKIYDLPVVGTQAHSWIMAFPDEKSAFETFAKHNPDNTVLLVDTYHTEQGVLNAIEIGKQLNATGKQLIAIRLDSGDLLSLSQLARKLLDQAELLNTKIMASGDLNEARILELKKAKAPIDIWGIGTKLATASDEPYLNSAYKLAALKNDQNQWEYKIKVSDSHQKSTQVGIHQVRRYYQDKHYLADVIYDDNLGITEDKPYKSDAEQDLLQPIFRSGKLMYTEPNIHNLRKSCISNVEQFLNSHHTYYKAQIDKRLIELKEKIKRRASL